MNEGGNGSAASIASAANVPSTNFRVDILLRLLSILVRTTGLVLSLHRRGDSRVSLHHWSRAVLRTLGVSIELQGNLQPGPRLWVSNHLSWVDPLLLLSLRPSGVLAKGEVAGYPFIGKISRRLSLAFVDRADAVSRASAVVRLAAELRRGDPMLLFPEGTTTRGHGLAPLQEGGLRVAYRCRVPVQTVRLYSADPAYPWVGDDALMPHFLQLIQSPSIHVRVEAGEVLEPGQFPTEEDWIEAIRLQLTPRGRFER